MYVSVEQGTGCIGYYPRGGAAVMNIDAGWQGETLQDNLERRGVSRRDFMKLCSGLAAVFTLVLPLARGQKS